MLIFARSIVRILDKDKTMSTSFFIHNLYFCLKYSIFGKFLI